MLKKIWRIVKGILLSLFILFAMIVFDIFLTNVYPISYKGNHRLSKDFVMPRKAHHRGKQNTKRGISRELVCVSCMVDQNNGMQAEIAGLGRIKFSQLEHLNKVETGAILRENLISYLRQYYI